MADRMCYPESDPRHHTGKLQDMLDEVVRHAREDVGKVDEPKAQALFETTAEECAGLTKAYAHYEQRSEAAWQR